MSPRLIFSPTIFIIIFVKCKRAAAGKGKLLVGGLNFTGLDENEPSALGMANFVPDYMKSCDFNPQAEISVDELKTYMKKCAEKPVRESIMTQFWEMDDAPGESKKFWKESKEYLAEEYAKEYKK